MIPIIERWAAIAATNPDIEVLWLYSSPAKGCANQRSDYDFAVVGKACH